MKKCSWILLLGAFSASLGAADNPPDTVLVKWRDLSFTQRDYEAALQVMSEGDRIDFQRDFKRVTQLLENQVVLRTLASEAKAMGLDKDPLMQAEMAQAMERVLTRKRLEVFEKTLKKPDFAAAALEQYKLNLAQHRVPDQVSASHILVTAKNRSDDEARQRAEEARKKALAGADFAALAKEYSEDPSAAKNSGDLGSFSKGRMVKPFEDAVFALTKPGDISEVVKTQFGYHVIRLNALTPGRQKSFDEVKDAMIKELETKYVADEKALHLSKIKGDPSIVMNTEAIDKLLRK